MFQSSLNTELHKRITGPGAEQLIAEIRHSATLLPQLPADLQCAARDAYAASLRTVFVAAACSTFVAYLIRWPVPDKSLDDDAPLRDRKTPESPALSADGAAAVCGSDWESESEDETLYVGPHSRRLSVCASEVAFDLPASPFVGVEYVRSMTPLQQDDPEARS